ncbi:electron transport complex subunit RsxD [Thiofilum flexile]|uniref:electron transport complex subunit RsxD n=1 Tax=Thiofilum flexile TaxID=125627 RepID=UPI00038116B0|nr:electron transport complex subunit RsxD [Thiofilum flexile]
MNPNYTVAQVMQLVLLALIPGIALMLWFFGWGVLTNLLIACLLAVALESLLLYLRKRPIKPFLSDYSAVLTACLLALALPPYAPWWVIAVGIVMAIIIAKHLYGGLGYNAFNPAMVGYAALLVSFPLEMTVWPVASGGFGVLDFHSTLLQVFGSGFSGWDAYTHATALDSMKTGLSLHQTPSQLLQTQSMGLLGGQGWEWINLAYLIGGGWLLYKRIITWHIPVAMLLGLSLFASLFWLYSPDNYPTPIFHLFSGATMLGAFFIATDPVTASTTPVGKLVFGFSIGALLYIIRTWGGYPDAVAFAVIVMNMAVPLLDTYTQPRIYGQRRGL